MSRGSNARSQLVDQQPHRGAVAGEIVAQPLAREIARPTQADDTRRDERRVIACAVETVLSTLAEGRQRQAVVLSIRTAENDAGAVVKPDIGGVDLTYRTFADDMLQRRT